MTNTMDNPLKLNDLMERFGIPLPVVPLEDPVLIKRNKDGSHFWSLSDNMWDYLTTCALKPNETPMDKLLATAPMQREDTVCSVTGDHEKRHALIYQMKRVSRLDKQHKNLHICVILSITKYHKRIYQTINTYSIQQNAIQYISTR